MAINFINLTEKKKTYYLESEYELQRLFLDLFLKEKDIVVLDGSKSYGNVLLESNFNGRIIAIMHNKHYFGYDPMNEFNLANKPVLENIDRIYKIVTASNKQCTDIVERLNNCEQVITIPVGIKSNNKRNDLAISPEKVIRIGVVARYAEQKRLEHAIQAFSLIQKQFTNSELHLYGFSDPHNYQTIKELKDLVEELHLTSSVKFRGYFSDLNEEYKKMHFKILTSRFEGFCIAVLEAISRGIPVVSYDINYGPADMIDDGDSGYLVKNGDYKQLANCVIKLINDPELYNSFSKAAYLKANDFSKEKNLELWGTILKE